ARASCASPPRRAGGSRRGGQLEPREAPERRSVIRGMTNGAEPTAVDYTVVVREGQSAILASAERITVVGRWVVLAAAVILNHFGNRNSQASVLVVDTILFGWGLVNLVVSVVLVR